jgi:hypothetical protein
MLPRVAALGAFELFIESFFYPKHRPKGMTIPCLFHHNEYGRKLPAEFEDYKAARDLSRWLLQQSVARMR